MKGYTLFARVISLVDCNVIFFSELLVAMSIFELNAVISVNLNPTQRSKNLAKPCLIKSIDFFSDKYSEINKLFAEIKEDNIASQKTFISVGFKKFNVENNIGFFQKSLI